MEDDFNDRLLKAYNELVVSHNALQSENERLTELEADAKRYRWLRGLPFSGLDIFELDWEDGDLDAAIDGEMLP